MNVKKIIMSAAFVLATTTCWAQFQYAEKPQGPQPGGASMQQNRPQAAVFNEDFFPPDLIIRNQQSLGLSDEQKTAIREVMKKSVSQSTDLQWQCAEQEEAMASLLKQEKVDESKTMAQLDKLLTIENEIKKLHLSTMIKIKNLLTPEQQTKLRTFRKPMFLQGERRGPNPRERQEGENPPSPEQP